MLRRTAEYLYLAAGILLVGAPIVREFNPWGIVNGTITLLQFLAIVLFVALVAQWTRRAERSDRIWVQVGNLGLAMLSVVAGIWMIPYLGSDALIFLEATPPVIGFGCLTIGMVLFSAVEAAGRNLVLIVILAMALAFVGQYLPGEWVPLIRPSSFVTYLVYGSEGIFGLALDIIVNIVLVFVMFGVAFQVAGGDKVVQSIAMRFSPGGPSGAIKTCVIASGLFGTVSGAAVSNVMTSGAFTIPSMRRVGVRNETAAGIEAAASSCGQIMPPVLGATAFFLADFAGVSYGTVVLASIAPAFLCYYAFFRQADLVKVDPNASIETDVPPPKRSDLLFLVPPAGMVALLLQSSAQVTLAGIVGVALCLTVALLRKGPRGTVAALGRALPGLISSCLMLILTAAVIGLLLAAVYSTGLAIAGAIAIGNLAETNLALALISSAVVIFVLGMGVTTVGVYVVAATLLVPGIVAAGIPPLAAHFFVLYCSLLSLITPPVAFASMAASALAKADFSRTAREAVKFGWMLFVMPFLIVLKPGLLLGSWVELGLSFTICMVFVTLATDIRLGRMQKAALIAVSLVALVWPGAPWYMAALSLTLVLPLAIRARHGALQSR